MTSSNFASVSVLESINADLQSAYDHCVASGLPAQLLEQTGHSSIELSSPLLGFKSPFGVYLNHAAYSGETGYTVSLSISCVRGPDGSAHPFGLGKTALAQKDENPSGKPQWFSLSVKVDLDEAPAGAGDLLEKAVAYHEEADNQPTKVGLATRRDEHPVWLTGLIRFRLAAGGKYGLYVDAIDLDGAVWHGSGSGSAPIAPTTLDHVQVVDVSAFAKTAAAEAADAPAKSQAISATKRRTVR
jgi:hypothetical protein